MVRKLKILGTILTVFIVICLSSSFHHKDRLETSLYDCFGDNTSYSDGEVLLYRVYYNWNFMWVPAGEVKFMMTEYEDTYQYEVIGKSFSSYESIFRVNDYYSSIIDKETMLPQSFVRYIEEGDYRKFDSLAFDQKTLQVLSMDGKNKSKVRSESFDIDKCALDLLSVLYSLRNTDVEAYSYGDYLDIDMFFDRENFPIHVVYDKKEKKKVKDLGTYNSIKVSPELIAGNVFNEGDVMNIWVTDDKNKVPLLVESPISVGSIKAVLTDYKGLRHPSELDR